MYDWFSGPRVTMLFSGTSVLLIAIGTFYSVGQVTRSTYFCFNAIDSRPWVLFLQFLGLPLDTAIIILFWKTMAWTRTTKRRLRMLGTILALSSLSMGLVWIGSKIVSGCSHQFSLGFSSLCGFDIIVDSVAFALLLMSAALWICETSPMIPTTFITILVGVWSSCENVVSWADWRHTTRPGIIMPPWTIILGTVFFLYFQDIRSIFFFRRILLALLLLAAVIGATIYVAVRQPATYYKNHPISDLIYKSHVDHERWLRKVTVSQTLAIAVTTYEERHSGKAAPPNFSKWYQYAEGTAVIDDFLQIDRDLAPFWSVKPETLRKGAEIMAATPSVVTITIMNGAVTHSGAGDSETNSDLQGLVGMVKKFSKHLPDMVVPMNLGPSPRILPTWEEAHSHGQAHLSSMGDVIFKRSPSSESNITDYAFHTKDDLIDLSKGLEEPISAIDYRQMQLDGCAPGSQTRINPQWNIAEFCSKCIRKHSKQQLLTKWDKAMETCAQPDLKYLHGLFMTSPQSPPIRQLIPLFSLAKTDSFSDILIPSPRVTRGENPDIRWHFRRRYDTLFWGGNVGEGAINHQALRGSHKYRLMHLLTAPGARDEVTMILPTPAREDRFSYEKIPALEASNVAPFVVGVGNYSACLGENCDIVKKAYGEQQSDLEPLEYRYVLLLDEDDGPSPQQERTIRSNSVPFISTVFTTWYTERIRPWLHFVPIDPRYQALHTTYLYFTGTENRGKIAGRNTNMKGRLTDAEWIAQEGKKWAEKALGERDMEVYLFRLLLEWGRLIDDQRDRIGFRRTEKGFDNIGFTERKEAS